MKRATDGLMATLALALAAAAILITNGPFAGRAEASGGSKAASLFAPDKGTFKILVSGQQIGKEEFEISPSGGNWVAKGSSELNTSDGMTKVSGSLELREDGTPVSYEWSTQGAKKAGATISFNGATATIDLRIEGRRPFTQEFTFQSPQIAVLDNNLYYQYAVLARLYDRDKKGAQTFSVLVPQELTPGTLTVESLGDQNAGNGKKMEELVVKTEDLEVDLFLDGGKLVRIVAPSTNAEIDRL
ncbi:MAG TPA: hypothetical protein VN885_08075 [Candidatus Acidoferrales bacterium]|nr:hypothetical protein [Candidatus Acidoferrales bacterium]